MTSTTTSHDERHFYDILEGFSTAMLVSQGADGLHARPMAIAAIEADKDKLWFATSLNTEKVDELLAHPQVNVAFQGKTQYASVCGEASVLHDRAKIDELWNESWRTWFPDGKDQADLVLIAIDASHGELWDSSGTKGLSYLFEAAKAYISGTTPDESRERHAEVKLNGQR